MHGSRIQTIATVAALGMFAAGSQLSVAETAVAQSSTPIKKLMGENFGGLQTILYQLISANYGAIPEQAEVIRQHALKLTSMVPESAKNDRERFLAYANNLAAHAQDMKTISQTLIEHDRGKSTIGADYLREALASHYGGMVTMCVACHNRYRPWPVQP